MNKLFLSISIVFGLASTAFADTSYLLREPVFPGTELPFSARNTDLSENGICRALGYERAAENSKRDAEGGKRDTIRVNDEGRIVQGPYTWAVGQIVCINNLGTPSTEEAELLENPTHPQSGLPFSARNADLSENGICRALGYERAAENSKRDADGGKRDTIRVNNEGQIVQGPYTWAVGQIVCIRSF